MVAVPLCVPVTSRTVTCPLCVRASAGSIDPSVVVKLTTVPFWTGVPAPLVEAPLVTPVPFSMTVAMMFTELFRDAVGLSGINVITVPVGASSGTLSQATAISGIAKRTARMAERRCDIMTDAKDNTLMGLQGQGGRRSGGDAGYAMAALLVMIGVMAIVLSAVMPVWRHESQREKEAEMVFRGQQYVRAIRLYQSRFQTLPPSFDVLVSQRFLRKKFKDPITNDDFQPRFAGQTQPGAPGQNSGRGTAGNPGSFASSQGAITGVGGIIGVTSKSKDTSIRIYNGATHYNEWQFLYVNTAPGRLGAPGGRGQIPGRPGGPGVGPGGGPGFPGGRGTNPGGRGGRGVGPGVQPFPGTQPPIRRGGPGGL